MAIVQIHKDKYILKQSTRGVSVVFREAFGHVAHKTDTMVCVKISERGRVLSTSGYSWNPNQSGKALQLIHGCCDSYLGFLFYG